MMGYRAGYLSMIGAAATALLAGQAMTEQQPIKPGHYHNRQTSASCLAISPNPLGADYVNKWTMLFHCFTNEGGVETDRLGVGNNLVVVVRKYGNGKEDALALAPQKNCKNGILEGEFRVGEFNVNMLSQISAGGKPRCVVQGSPEALREEGKYRSIKSSVVTEANFVQKN